ncbi:hypothetical protein F5J12DRAFT_970669, partial [Pisolithus orientalis]|uniref:uncharacterized protein n=1 Tax=Pisolithus orientalis TaxID=936130 RepID=UPI002223FC5B
QISDNNPLDYTYIKNITHAHQLTGDGLIPCTSCSPTTLSKPKLDLKGATAVFIKSLHHTLPPICATTEYHCILHSSLQLLSPYVTPPPNAESILSMFNTSFDPH